MRKNRKNVRGKPVINGAQETAWFEGLYLTQTITLNHEDRDFFLTLLASDDEPNEALKKAADDYKRAIREGNLIRR